MKKSTFFLLILAICFGYSAHSQDTLRLFGNKRTPAASKRSENTTPRYNSDIKTLTGPGQKVGFYVGFHSEYSQIDGHDAFGAGGSIALVANHSLAIGFAGKGFFSEPYSSAAGTDLKYNYSGGYGGFLIEPILFPKSPVHVSFPILLGAGGIAKSSWYNYNYPYEYTQIEIDDAEAFLVAEPGVELEFNIARWMRLGLGASYRFTSDLDQASFNSDIMNGFTGGFSLKFGKF